MFLLVKQVSKPSATLEQTQEPSPKPSLCELPLQGTTGNGLAIHTQLCLISLLMRKSKQADLHSSPTPWADYSSDSCYLPRLANTS